MGTEWFEQNVGLFALLLLWDLVWKGVALWKAAQNDSKVWFVVILVINSVGILPITYLILANDRKRRKA